MQRVDFIAENGNKADSCAVGQAAEPSPAGALRNSSLPEARRQALSGRLEFFTGFAWCQALIFKSWVEASDRLMRSHSEAGQDREVSSLYIDIHEEIFTNLFKSQLYASNVGRMVNASMVMLKNWKALSHSSAPKAGQPRKQGM